MDFHFNKPEAGDGVPRLPSLRPASSTTASRPRIRFVGELELEHAFVEGLEEAGELELEQAYVDFLLTRGFNLRAGMLLVPMGIINERHEPPVFHGVERPFVDTVIIPTTWFDAGAGVHGELGRGFRYRAYVMAPLNALEFSRRRRHSRTDGRRAPRRTSATRPFAGRRNTSASANLTAGRQRLDAANRASRSPRLDYHRHVGEVDARYKRDRLELRGQFAQVGSATPRA